MNTILFASFAISFSIFSAVLFFAISRTCSDIKSLRTLQRHGRPISTTSENVIGIEKFRILDGFIM